MWTELLMLPSFISHMSDKGFYVCPYIQMLQNIICLKYMNQNSMRRIWPSITQKLTVLCCSACNSRFYRCNIKVLFLFQNSGLAEHSRLSYSLKINSHLQWTTPKLTKTVFWALTIQIGWICTSSLMALRRLQNRLGNGSRKDRFFTSTERSYLFFSLILLEQLHQVVYVLSPG